ncbi:MAG: peptidoglycan DD-metalloendopeptidase family protein [Bacilli bacterium]|nr:peptidoglycan DD-metalloendopeptidase family protein [Bacilli bacterium]
MKESFKKIRYILLVLILLVVNFSVPTKEVAEAKTLRDLKEELAQKEANLKAGVSEKLLTEQEIATKKESINKINIEIDSIQQELINLTEEIEQLNVEIVEKEKEIKNIINYYQLSSSESAYLEYIFEAVDFTDFIYRMAITEQLSDYNDKLIDEYHQKIKENEQKKKDLDAKTISLNEKQNQLQAELVSLGDQLGSIVEENVTMEEEIRSLKKVIDTYEKTYNCGLDEDINTCGKGKLPVDTAFYRPVKTGRVSSNYGWRTYWINGAEKTDFHYGVDISRTGYKAPVNPIAAGRVAYIEEQTKCGGNRVYIHHDVKGQKYTSGYFHLAYINVKVGDIVTTESVIGGVGGIESYDGCSTAVHLHLQISTTNIEPLKLGFYSRFTARSFNPRNVLNLPKEGSFFYDKTTKY